MGVWTTTTLFHGAPSYAQGDLVATAGIRGELTERTAILATAENSDKVGLATGLYSEQGPSEGNTHKQSSHWYSKAKKKRIPLL